MFKPAQIVHLLPLNDPIWKFGLVSTDLRMKAVSINEAIIYTLEVFRIPSDGRSIKSVHTPIRP